ncbi:N-acyl-D-amino-acid deacylase family protein [Paralcaligenes ureilyticus]|uniref:Dihydroorotase n=1 Tax=Paralcaligenes ureilyticus TaxID=627131 RepID=A0A4R3LUD9_9BURK|nr:D-aminoacylase [Paralcaligenes ureilyticus]TCT04124.1 dihydroorotase [Paralcaligenes ureilyticus]
MLTVLKNGLVCDGSAAGAVRADVWIEDEKIVAVLPAGDLPPGLSGASVSSPDCVDHDCTGLVIAPGFIDVHTHDDAIVLDHPDMLPKLSQGITTVVAGNCGISLVPMVTDEPQSPLSLLGHGQFRFNSLKDYRDAVNQTQPGVNVAALIGHTTLRMLAMADLSRPASSDEISVMSRMLDDAMSEGALGLSSGVFYRQAYAANVEELTALVKVVARHGGVYATHIRDEMRGIISAIEEAALTARVAGAFLVLSHHKCAGPENWGRTSETLPLIEKLALTQPIGMDVYPYAAGSTVLREDLVDGVIDILITGSDPHPEMIGRYLKDVADLWGVSQVQACQRLQPGGACYFQMQQDDVDRVVCHPLSMIGSDGLPHDKRPHPRLWGAFPRVLDQYWRVKGTLPLEQALHKMTGMSAGRYALHGRGYLKPGFFADIVVIDPDKVGDRATYAEPAQFSEGIEQVWVNGRLSFVGRDKSIVARAGRFVMRGS